MADELPSKEKIRAWLSGMWKKNVKGKPKQRPGVTLKMVHHYTGIPVNSLLWYARGKNFRMGEERHRILADVMTKVENGEIDWEVYEVQFEHGLKVLHKRLIRPEKPKPKQRFRATLGPRGITLTPEDRPKARQKMPSMEDLLGKD